MKGRERAVPTTGQEQSWEAGFEVGSFCHSWMEGGCLSHPVSRPRIKGLPGE